MRGGGKRRIRVSPHLGYRDQSIPANELFQVPIPPNFRVDLRDRTSLGRRSVAVVGENRDFTD